MVLNYKKIFFLIVSFFIFDITVVVGDKTFTTTNFFEEVNKIVVKKQISLIGTIYHANQRENDSTYLITASGKLIDTNKLNNNQLRYVALSRDLLKIFKLGGLYKYGDKINVISKYKEINGIWVVVDCTSKRMKNKIDFLVPSTVNNIKYHNIKIEKI